MLILSCKYSSKWCHSNWGFSDIPPHLSDSYLLSIRYACPHKTNPSPLFVWRHFECSLIRLHLLRHPSRWGRRRLGLCDVIYERPFIHHLLRHPIQWGRRRLGRLQVHPHFRCTRTTPSRPNDNTKVLLHIMLLSTSKPVFPFCQGLSTIFDNDNFLSWKTKSKKFNVICLSFLSWQVEWMPLLQSLRQALGPANRH